MKAARTHSLHARLLGFVLAAIAFASLVQGTSAYNSALRQADAMFDDHLQQMARSLRGGLPVMPSQIDGDEGEGEDYDLQVQIWGPDGAQIFRSPRSGLPPQAVLGFSDVTVGGTAYRVYSVQTPFRTIQIAQDLSARQARARAIAARAVLPIALMAPLLMLAVGWVIRRSLAPVERTRRLVAARAANDLSPLPEQDLPDEVRPLVAELNSLFGRVRAAFEAQQHFVADAAHELRSPLTALKLQAQALPRAGDPAAREAAATRLDQGIDRAIHLVEQLLALAREEAGSAAAQAGTPMQAVALQDVVRLAVGDTLAQARARPVDLGVAHAEPAAAMGRPEALRMLLRNLIDNAVKYTPAGGQVDVSLETRAGRAVLAVEDSGPGIAPEHRERVFDRFYRAGDAADARGSGLGLAIVKAIADSHGAALSLGHSERLGGLRVELRFPPVPSTAAPV